MPALPVSREIVGRREGAARRLLLVRPAERAASRTRPVLAFGHGFLQRPWRYAGLLAALAAQGFVVVAPDTQAGPLPSHRRLADDLWQAAAWALQTQPDVDPGRVVAAGHSMGGAAALLAATRHTGIERVVGIAALDTRPPMGAALGALRVPVLLVVGTRDTVVPPARTRALAAALPRPPAWAELTGAGHCGWLDSSFPRGAACGGQECSRAEQIERTVAAVARWIGH